MKQFLNTLSGFAILIAACLCLSPSASAQGLARIAGTVTDPTGAAVPNATVTATRLATGEKSTATANGSGDMSSRLWPRVSTASR